MHLISEPVSSVREPKKLRTWVSVKEGDFNQHTGFNFKSRTITTYIEDENIEYSPFVLQSDLYFWWFMHQTNQTIRKWEKRKRKKWDSMSCKSGLNAASLIFRSRQYSCYPDMPSDRNNEHPCRHAAILTSSSISLVEYWLVTPVTKCDMVWEPRSNLWHQSKQTLKFIFLTSERIPYFLRE